MFFFVHGSTISAISFHLTHMAKKKKAAKKTAKKKATKKKRA
jgi:hypothetical protein